MIVMRDEHYIVEVNEGIYLRELLNAYRFTNDIKKASIYENRYEAWQTAKECGGTDKQYVITYEVIPCNF
ncbi:hypothetical protein [Staphylococcus cohnii]